MNSFVEAGGRGGGGAFDMTDAAAESDVAWTLRSLLQRDVNQWMRLMLFMFVVSCVFTAGTLPELTRSAGKFDPEETLGIDKMRAVQRLEIEGVFSFGGRDESGAFVLDGVEETLAVRSTCQLSILLNLHAFVLVVAVGLQLLQLPVKVALVSWSLYSYLKDGESAQRLDSILCSEMWNANHYMGFVGQYLLPTFGLLVAAGAKMAGLDAKTRPCGTWPRLGSFADMNDGFFDLWEAYMGWMIFRLLVTFVVGLVYLPKPAGATSDRISTLETFWHEGNETLHLTQCPICLIEYDEPSELIRLPCDSKHVFHSSCIRSWLMKQKSCPLCIVDIDVASARKSGCSKGF